MDQRKRNILEILQRSSNPLSGKEVAHALAQRNFDVSDRTVRMDMQDLEDRGLIELLHRKGRRLTSKGLEELNAQRVLQRVGLLSSRINQLTYGMDFDLNLRRGKVIVNVTLIQEKLFQEYLDRIMKVFELGFAMGDLVGLLLPGESMGGYTVPEGSYGLCTVCSITLNGVLIKHGIPVESLFSGVMDVQDYKPFRFSEIIHYNGTSIDPLALFIQSGMTDYLGAISSGVGRIGAGFRQVPSASYDLVTQLAEKLKHIGLGGFMAIGKADEELYNIPVQPGACGITVIGGLNPTAVFEESGIRLESRALGGLMDFTRLFHYQDLPKRLQA